ncbi:ROK family protein [Microbacterium testaceum]|uniref:HTH marR-type domain-containing protein n=1 Tax=Microbacterium testaceum TaxID=2033 RepID=A0A147F909_MICTE|nr:ROK family protein [Microbacterium testaceum]KTS13070.1 hypothetical protein RSA3_06585 [Microbacterium testaceum]
MTDADRAAPRPPTRSVVLELIRAAGPISRIELAAATALTPASMTTVVRELIRDGLVTEVGQGTPTRGKPRTLLEARPDARYAVGVLLGFGSTSYVAVNLWGEVVAERDGAGAGNDPPATVVRRVADDVRRLIVELDVDPAIVTGAGVVVPGPIDSVRGTAVQLPAERPWSDFGLRAALSEATGLPVVMENDATAAAVGEYYSRATRGESTFATIHMGVGIGAGIVIGGEPLRGASANAGEIGHLSVDFDGPLCHCGNRGCLELVAAPFAVELAYAQRTGRSLAWSEIVSGALTLGDGDAVAVLTRAADALGVAITGLVNLLDVGLVVLTGDGFGAAADFFATRAQESVDRAFFARRTHPVRVTVSAHPSRAAALGGAALALRSALAG